MTNGALPALVDAKKTLSDQQKDHDLFDKRRGDFPMQCLITRGHSNKYPIINLYDSNLKLDSFAITTPSLLG
jgi:hypothetical protein